MNKDLNIVEWGGRTCTLLVSPLLLRWIVVSWVSDMVVGRDWNQKLEAMGWGKQFSGNNLLICDGW